MTRFRECRREADVLDLVSMGLWPERAPADLAAHVRDCEACADLATVASAIGGLRDGEPPVRVPDAARVWHQAQLRARHEAARRAARPIDVALIGGAGAAAATVGAWGSGLLNLVWGWTARLAAAIEAWATDATSIWDPLTTAVTRTLAIGEVSPTLRWVALGALVGAALLLPVGLWVSRLVDSSER